MSSDIAHQVVTLNAHPHYAHFLPEKGDVVLACSDLTREGARRGFLLSKAELSKHSVFFRDMFSLEGQGASMGDEEPLFVEESSDIVGIVLSALFEPSRELLVDYNKSISSDLAKALSLAIKWQIESARPAIFYALIFRLSRNYVVAVDLRLIAESLHQGEAATGLLKLVLRSYKSARGKAFTVALPKSNDPLLDLEYGRKMVQSANNQLMTMLLDQDLTKAW